MVAPGVKQVIETAPAHASARPLTEQPITITEEDWEGRTRPHAEYISKHETGQLRFPTAAALAGHKAALIVERERKKVRVEYGDTNKERVALAPKKVMPRSPIHFGAEIGGELMVPDDAPIEEMTAPGCYWSLGYVPGEASLHVGRVMHITNEDGSVSRGIRLKVTKIVPGHTPDSHWIEVEVLEAPTGLTEIRPATPLPAGMGHTKIVA
jgi:hypothetical protein